MVQLFPSLMQMHLLDRPFIYTLMARIKPITLDHRVCRFTTTATPIEPRLAQTGLPSLGLEMADFQQLNMIRDRVFFDLPFSDLFCP